MYQYMHQLENCLYIFQSDEMIIYIKYDRLENN